MPLSRLSVLKQSLFFEKICCCLQSFDAAMRGFSLASALPPLHPFPATFLLTAKMRLSPMAAHVRHRHDEIGSLMWGHILRGSDHLERAYGPEPPAPTPALARRDGKFSAGTVFVKKRRSERAYCSGRKDFDDKKSFQ